MLLSKYCRIQISKIWKKKIFIFILDITCFDTFFFMNFIIIMHVIIFIINFWKLNTAILRCRWTKRLFNIRLCSSTILFVIVDMFKLFKTDQSSIEYCFKYVELKCFANFFAFENLFIISIYWIDQSMLDKMKYFLSILFISFLILILIISTSESEFSSWLCSLLTWSLLKILPNLLKKTFIGFHLMKNAWLKVVSFC